MRVCIVVAVALFVQLCAADACPAAQALMAQERSGAALTIPSIPVPLANQPLSYIHVGGCLRVDIGWWTYELCPGKFLRQFHREQDAIASEFFLGFGPHALDGDEVDSQRLRYQDRVTSMKEQLIRVGMERAVSRAKSSHNKRAHCRRTPNGLEISDQVVVEYTGGTICDVSRKPRRTSVIYVCDHKQPQIQWNITETSCVYTVFIVSRMSCNMMNIVQSEQQPAAPARSSVKKFHTYERSDAAARRRKLMDIADGVASRTTTTTGSKDAMPITQSNNAPAEETHSATTEADPPVDAPQQLRDDNGDPLSFESNMIFSCV